MRNRRIPVLCVGISIDARDNVRDWGTGGQGEKKKVEKEKGGEGEGKRGKGLGPRKSPLILFLIIK